MKSGKNFICPNCDKAFFREFRQIKKGTKNCYCSQCCHYKHKLIKALERATSQYSQSWQKLIYQWYVIDKMPIRKIAEKLKLSNRIIPKALKLLNIKQRTPHERIKLQWKNNDKRRGELAKQTSKIFKGKPAWNHGLTKKTHPGIKKQAEWMNGSNNPMYGKRGKAHHQYKNGKYTAEKKRYWGTSEYRRWRKAVFKRDNYTCQKCGYHKGNIINAHHIKPVKDYPELIFDISNGITLCEKCHQIIHASSTTGPILHLQLLWIGGASTSS